MKLEGPWFGATLALNPGADRVVVTAAGPRTQIADWVVVAPSGPRTEIHVFEAASGRLLTTTSGEGIAPGSNVAFLADGRRIVTTHADGTAWIRSIESGEIVTTLTGHLGPILAILVTPDGGRIFTGGMDNTVRVWDALRSELLLTLRTAGEVTALAMSPGGHEVVAGTRTGTVYVWDAGKPGLDQRSSAGQ